MVSKAFDKSRKIPAVSLFTSIASVNLVVSSVMAISVECFFFSPEIHIGCHKAYCVFQCNPLIFYALTFQYL